MVPETAAVKVVAWPPLIPAGPVKVKLSVKVPLTGVSPAVDASTKLPMRSAPLNEPPPPAVVAVKVLPEKVRNWAAVPVIVPDEVPETVTGSALAICAALKIARSAMLMVNGLSMVAKFFMMYLTSVNPCLRKSEDNSKPSGREPDFIKSRFGTGQNTLERKESNVEPHFKTCSRRIRGGA